MEQHIPNFSVKFRQVIEKEIQVFALITVGRWSMIALLHNLYVDVPFR